MELVTKTGRAEKTVGVRRAAGLNAIRFERIHDRVQTTRVVSRVDGDDVIRWIIHTRMYVYKYFLIFF